MWWESYRGIAVRNSGCPEALAERAREWFLWIIVLVPVDQICSLWDLCSTQAKYLFWKLWFRLCPSLSGPAHSWKPLGIWSTCSTSIQVRGDSVRTAHTTLPQGNLLITHAASGKFIVKKCDQNDTASEFRTLNREYVSDCDVNNGQGNECEHLLLGDASNVSCDLPASSTPTVRLINMSKSKSTFRRAWMRGSR